MNIHLKSKADFDKLISATYLTIEVGSHLYGTQNENSDRDYLHLYAESFDDTKSFLWTHNQLQYRQGDSDHNFTTIRSFVRNLLSGDSTVNFEALFSAEIRERKDLGFLVDFIPNFYSYNLMRSYLGLAKRDLKMYKKGQGRNKLFHVKRALWTVDLLLEKNYSSNFESTDKTRFDELMKFKNGEAYGPDKVAKLFEEIDRRRFNLNEMLMTNVISKSPRALDLVDLDEKIIAFQKTDVFNQKRLDKRLVLESQYSSLFEGIVYPD
jgi:predicted nucleotidyltransferase